MTQEIKCPCCRNVLTPDSEQAICLELFDECIFCRFSPNSKGSKSGTQAELAHIVVRQEAKRRFNNQQPKTIDMQKLVGSGAPVVLPPHPPLDQGADYERGFVEGRSWEVQTRANKFKPDYNTEAVLVEEMQRMGKRIDDLEMLLQVRAEQIVGLQDEIRNLTGEE